MKKMITFRLKESSIESIKRLSEQCDLSQADIIEKIIDFAVLVIDNKDNNNIIDNQFLNGIYQSLLQSLKS